MSINENIVRKATQTTTSLNAGILNPEQAKRFLVEAQDATPLLGLIRNEYRTATTGEIDKIGIQSRVIRKKTENTDDGYRAEPTTGKVEYACTAVRLPWDITEETLRQNIEGQNYEAIISRLMSTQFGVDIGDLCINGDTATASSDADYDFLKINDGWIKLITANGHISDRSSISSGAMSIDVFYDLLKTIPSKYNNGKLRWIMSPRRKQEWDKYLFDKMITNGGGVMNDVINNPAAIPVVEEPNFPDSKILLTDPKNLIKVQSYNVVIRKTTEGKEAVMQDKRFYVIHTDFDPIVEEYDATAIAVGLA